MKARAPIWKKLVEEHLAKGMSHREVAEVVGLPVGTVKTWKHRAARRGDLEKGGLGDMKPAMKPALAKGKAGEMKPGTKPGPVMYRGLTARDMPGRDRVQKQLNFAAFRRDAYPPATWKIPGYLEGAELAKAMLEACEKFKPKMRRGKV